MRTTDKGAALSVAVVGALVAGATMGSVGGNLMPMLLAGFGARFHLSHTESGIVAATQLLATAAATLSLAGRATRPGRPRLARSGLLLASGGFALAGFARSYPELLACGLVAGAGLGAVFAASAAGLAAVADSDRATVVAVLGSTVATAALMLGLPAANDRWGGSAGFVVLALCCLVALPAVGRLPDGWNPPEPGLASARGSGPGWGILVALAVLAGTDQGAWSYAGVLGESQAHLSARAVATVLSVAAGAALLGGAGSAKLVGRLGRRSALGLCIATEALAKLGLTTTDSGMAYVAAAIVWQVAYLAIVVMLLSLAASTDRHGRWVAAFGGAIAVGAGLGPAVTGAVLDGAGARALGVLIASVSLLAAIPLLRIAAAADSMPAEVPGALGGASAEGSRIH